jgi:hypothetical protein
MIFVRLAKLNELRSTARQRRVALNLVVFLGVSWGTMGCESDPLLAPQSEDKEEKGSYGLSSFPEDSVDPTPYKKANPELF